MTIPQATSSKNWRKRVGGQPVELPSGNTCLVKKPSMDSLLKAGIMPDSLTPIAMEHIRQAEAGGRPVDQAKADEDMQAEILDKVMSSPDEMAEIFLAFDRVTAMCVVEPKVLLHVRQAKDAEGNLILSAKGKPTFEDIPEENRISDEQPESLDDGTPNPLYAEDPPLYTDEIDSEDKQTIFQFVLGGQAEIEPFRGEPGPTVAGAQSGEDVSLPPV